LEQPGFNSCAQKWAKVLKLLRPLNSNGANLANLQSQAAHSVRLRDTVSSKDIQNGRREIEMEPPAWSALIPVAQYVRMSTDDQKYSPHNQSAANDAYAAAHGMMITRTYFDEGKSGLTFGGRGGLNLLIKDVLNGEVDFEAILVLDVSRWGRFQDPDESAYYEYSCKRAGIAVHYSAEQFENDGSPLGAIAKWLKRSMAGEFSRELSVKVYAGQHRLSKLGFRLGGHPGYGLRRLLVDQNGSVKCALQKGEWKSISTDRVILTHGPTHEIELVRWIFSMFVQGKKVEYEIAKLLNERGLRNHHGYVWKGHTVRYILKNENYIGNYVWNRKSFKLRKIVVRNGPDSWMRTEDAFEAIVERSTFEAAQAIFRDRTQRTPKGRPRWLSDEEMLKRLSQVFRKQGRLSRRIIDTAPHLPSCWAYSVRFGGVANAYDRVGFKKNVNQYGVKIKDRNLPIEPCTQPRGFRDDEMLGALKLLLKDRGYLSAAMINGCKDMPSAHAFYSHFGGLERAYELIGYERPYRTRPSFSNEDMLEVLRSLSKKHGKLSRKIINATDGIPSAGCYYDRFGSLGRAYKLIEYEPNALKSYTDSRGVSNEMLLSKLRSLLSARGYLSGRLIDRTRDMPSRTLYCNRFGSLRRVYELIEYAPRVLKIIRYEPRTLKSRTVSKGMTNEDLLDTLRGLLLNRGYLSGRLIDRTAGMPSRILYYKRFGSLRRAYGLIGYTP
jgi:DNA invertase Pin-like site-specific DNA recombinase